MIPFRIYLHIYHGSHKYRLMTRTKFIWSAFYMIQNKSAMYQLYAKWEKPIFDGNGIFQFRRISKSFHAKIALEIFAMENLNSDSGCLKLQFEEIDENLLPFR